MTICEINFKILHHRVVIYSQRSAQTWSSCPVLRIQRKLSLKELMRRLDQNLKRTRRMCRNPTVPKMKEINLKQQLIKTIRKLFFYSITSLLQMNPSFFVCKRLILIIFRCRLNFEIILIL